MTIITEEEFRQRVDSNYPHHASISTPEEVANSLRYEDARTKLQEMGIEIRLGFGNELPVDKLEAVLRVLEAE